MKTFAAVLAVVSLSVSFGAQAAEKAKNAVLTPAADLKWSDTAFPEVKMAVVEGDAAKGAHHAFHKFTAGFTAPMHHHNSDHYVTVVSGNMVLTVDGVETKLAPGSYFSFTKKQTHGTRCEPGAECVLFVDSRGKWDVLPEKADGKADAKPAEPVKK